MKKSFIVLCLLLANILVFAQDYSRSRVQFSINGGISLPLGKFGETSNDYYCAPFNIYGADELEIGYGAAKMGYNASIKLHIPIYDDYNDNIIGIITKFNFLYNGITDKEKRDFRNQLAYMAESLNEEYNVNAYYYKVGQYSSYRNFSLMIGGDYTHYFSQPFALFAEVSIGMNLASISDTKINNLYGGTLVYSDGYANYYSEDGTDIKYKNKFNFVYEIGAGLFLFDHVSLGVFYTGFSPFQVEAEMSAHSNYGSDDMNIISHKLKVSVLSFQLGIHF